MREPPTVVSPERKQLARHVISAFGGEARIHEYRNSSGNRSVDILSCRDRPVPGLTSYSTIGLSDHPMKWVAGEFPARLELAGVMITEASYFANVLASAAFTIMNGTAVYHPGTVIPEVVRQHHSTTRFPHLYLTAPFIWKRDLELVECESMSVAWLLAMPICETEYEYLRARGDALFEKLLSDRSADFSNPDRDPVI